MNSEKSRIVIIEDNPGDVLLIRKALDEIGLAYEMTRFEDGPEAIQALCPESGAPEFTPDVIVLDLNLPRSDGVDVLRHIRQASCLGDVPVAILTSSESPADSRKARDLGADRYILKPAELEAFFAQVGGGIKDLVQEAEARRRAGKLAG
jgi:CheY-like chemotaxis protein